LVTPIGGVPSQPGLRSPRRDSSNRTCPDRRRPADCARPGQTLLPAPESPWDKPTDFGRAGPRAREPARFRSRREEDP
jgi:hypothetical protein